MTIHFESEIRRKNPFGGAGATDAFAAIAGVFDMAGLLDDNRAGSPAQRGITITVRKVQTAPNHEPPPEAHPGEGGQPAHHEHAQRRPGNADEMNERHAERTFTL